jgi:hypothetical protein
MKNEPAFIYFKEGKIKVLNLEEAKASEKDLLADGWQHKATIDLFLFIEHLYNSGKIETELFL